jgi:hypothetical protein
MMKLEGLSKYPEFLKTKASSNQRIETKRQIGVKFAICDSIGESSHDCCRGRNPSCSIVSMSYFPNVFHTTKSTGTWRGDALENILVELRKAVVTIR